MPSKKSGRARKPRTQKESRTTAGLPASYAIGDSLDWKSGWKEVELLVELPFWLMVPDCRVTVAEAGHDFDVSIMSRAGEIHVREVLDSKRNCFEFGNLPIPPRKALSEFAQETSEPYITRKCKTVLGIESRCNSDVLAAASGDSPRRGSEANLYMRALCSAHIAVVNRVIRPYRLSTYDYFAYEVSPWDVPIWFVVPHGGPLLRVSMFDYADWDFKPHMFKGNTESEYELIDLDAFRSSLQAESGEGEIELLDALNFMERGDYSGAVRRVATALEAVVEAALKRELQKLYPEAEVVKRLEASKNDYPGRVRQYQKLSLRQLPESLDREMDATRDLRHRIVHRAYRIPFAERGQAQRSVDTGRWIYNWFEESPERNAVREKKVALRSLGRNLPVFDATITQSGVIVHGFGET